MGSVLESMNNARGGPGVRGTLWAALLVCLAAGGCWFHRGAPYPMRALPAPLPVAILPPAIKSDLPELRNLSLRATVIMAGIIEQAPDLEAVPFWHSIPLALNRLGASRTITPQTAAEIAELSGARWATACELAGGPNGISIMLDFMPANPTLIPFRYTGIVTADTLEAVLTVAFDQFLRYLGVRPLPAPQAGPRPMPVNPIALAEIFDREYGWFGRAAPGQSTSTALELERSDPALAHVLFDPALYAANPESAARAAEAAAESKAAAAAETRRPGSLTTITQPPVTEALPLIASSRQKAAPVPDLRNLGKPPAKPVRKSESIQPPAGLPAAAPPASEPSPAGRFELQVFATHNPKAAENEALRIQGAGFTAAVVPADLGDKGMWYRVRVSGFMTRAAALSTGRMIVAAGLAEEFWVVRS